MAGPLYADFGYGSNTVIGAVSVLGMGLMVWFLVPEPSTEPHDTGQGGGPRPV